MNSLTPHQALALDRIAREELGLSDLVLMENAGLRCAEWIVRNLQPRRVMMLCGSGNNGGDGLVIARQLAAAGILTGVMLAGSEDRMTASCQANWNIVQRWNSPELSIVPSMVALAPWNDADVVVDALLGISARGTPRDPMPALIEWANRLSARRVAIDVPTGLDPETGEPGPVAFAAGWTLMMERSKSLVRNPASRTWTGDVITIPLGLPPWVARGVAEKNRPAG
jgi:NAD(P)H-hydrate epimerase